MADPAAPQRKKPHDHDFLINVPIGALMIIAALRFIGPSERQTGRFDVLGAATSTLGMAALVYGIVRSAKDGWADPLTLAAVVAGVLLLALFVLIESKVSQPIMPLRLFRDRQRSGANGTRMLFLGAMLGYFFFITQYMQGVLGFSPLQAGLGFLPMTVANFVVALGIPRLTRRFGNSALLVTGIAITCVGMLWLSRIGADSEYFTAVALPMVLIGFGQGLAFAPMTAAGVAGIEPRDAGAGAGLVNVAHQLGGSLGLAVLVAVAAGVAGDGVDGDWANGDWANGAGAGAAAVAREASAALTTGALLLGLALVVAAVFVVDRKRSGPGVRSSATP